MPEIDTSNKFIIGSNGPYVVVMRPISGRLSKEDALNAAAYLAVIADEDGEQFDKVRQAVMDT